MMSASDDGWTCPPPPVDDDGLPVAETLEEFSRRVIPPARPDVAELPLVTAAALANKPAPPRRWHVPDIIPGKQVTELGGDGGVGKSTVAKQLAVATAAGKPWLGTSPEPGPVVYLSAEDDLDELHRRLENIAASYGVDLADLGHLYFVPLAGLDAVLAAPDAKGIVSPTRVWRGLVAIVERVRPRLVILDTRADVFAGNENARAEARQFVGLLRGLAIEHDLAVLLLAHPSLVGLSSGSGTSGSTAWSNSVRARLYLETIKGDDGRELDAARRVLRVKKANYAPSGTELLLRWSEGCFILEGAGGASAGGDRLTAQAREERIFFDLVASFNAQGRDVSPNRSNTYAPTVFAKHPDAEGLRKDRLEDAMNRLLKEGRIKVQTSGPPSRQRSRLVEAPSATKIREQE